MATVTAASAFNWIPGTTSAERVAAFVVFIALASTAVMGLVVLSHRRTIDEYSAAAMCTSTASDDCVSLRPGTVTAAPKQYRFGIESAGRASRHTARPTDARALDLLVVGTPVVVREWRGKVVEVAVNGSAIPTDEHPEEETSVAAAWFTAVALTIPMTLGIAYCVRCGEQNARAPHDARTRAGDYALPYVAHFRQFRGVATFLLAAGAALVAYAIWVDTHFGLVMLIVDLLMLALFWVFSQNRVTLDADSLTYGTLGRERVIPYQDITSVDARRNVVVTGRGGVGVTTFIRLGLRGRPPFDMNVSVLSERDRSIIVDRLQREANGATFSRDLHTLWTSSF